MSGPTFLGLTHLYVEFNNPSIREFALRRIGASKGLRQTLIDKAGFFEQLETLVELTPDGTRNIDSVWPELAPKDLVRHASQLILTRSSRLVRVFMRSNRKYRWYPATIIIGPRLRRLRSWMSGLPPEGTVTSEVVALARQLLDDQSARMDVAAFCELVRLVSVAGEYQEIVERICSEILKKLRADTPEMDDWREWGRMVEEQSNLIGPIEQYRAEAEAAIDQWIESAREYCVNEDDVGNYCDEIELIAGTYKVNVETKLKSVRKSLEDLEPSEPPPPDRRRPSMSDDRNKGDQEEKIRDLFDSLRA